MDYQFELSEQRSQPVLSIRKRTPARDLPRELAAAYGAIFEHLSEIGERPSGTPCAAYHNMDMEDLDVEIGVPVARPLPGKGDIKAGEIPAGRQVSCMYKGPYDQIEPAYSALTRWIEQKGETPTGVSYEFYYNSPLEVPESELLTKIVFPLK